MITGIQTHGELLHWYPHLHAFLANHTFSTKPARNATPAFFNELLGAGPLT